MRTVLLAGVRARASRLVATATAVVLSVGFLVGALALSATFEHTSEQSLTAHMARADVWVGATPGAAPTPTDEDVLVARLPGVRDAPHVVAADAVRTAYGRLRVGDTRSTAQVSALLDAPVRWQALTRGAWPVQPSDTTVDGWAARSLGLDVGDTVTVRLSRAEPVELTVVGITAPVGPGVVIDVPHLVVTADGLTAAGARPVTSEILVRGDGAAPEAVAAGVAAALADVPGLDVLTREDAAERRVAELSGSGGVLTAVLLGFCAVALVVAAIVIGNTFHVLVAQRTHELALLRCIGASTGQVHRLVVAEAAVLGAVASVGGVGLGLLGAHVLAVVRLSADGVVVAPAVPAAGVAVGVLLTVVAAWAPARRATRVRPVEALRPLDDVRPRPRRQWLRLVAALLLLGAGAGGAGHATQGGGVAVAVPAVIVSFLGVLLAAPLLVPACVRGLGALVAGASAATRLAARNAGRNRRRTTATATALLVGVTLVTTMVVATASVRSSVDAQIDARRPIDLVVTTSDPAGLDPATTRAVDDLPEVVGTAEVTGGVPVRLVLADGSTRGLAARGVDPVASRQLVRRPVPQPDDGTVLVHPDDAAGLPTDGTVQAVGAAGSAAAVVAVTPDTVPGTVTMRADELAALVSTPPVVELQVRLVSDLTGPQVQRAISSVLSIDERLDVRGGAPERAMYGHLLDLMLLVVLALLTLSLVIAVVGIGNTMALSVVERRRESAVLRALGLTVGQLRGMLAVEAALVAAVAGVLGAGLGIAYAWTGVMALGQETTRIPMHLVVPGRTVGLIVAAAVVCGAGASFLPGRRAGKVPPAQALAVE
ncbi:protein of unknown function DUF214 [Cellulomonas flavigena DSM 20109]|uniref:ABC3 transporter permease protein domain-containing protein n=1 Tax=Cellulomonas flavigena (strain ATCC 482 / DSM 20109 / BCRC 11376 / JCM 18109 / NBRC 3775 / NCIMB 8073 / NRS 134) TaxID=446466 RepID=D5UKE4_CELFN|nr:FtsX-like permease family protein [Cellulomonas flavigena]ADG75805.1 protein of unknown function DUF214 [Cellulomonas flavigena DSM 20109]